MTNGYTGASLRERHVLGHPTDVLSGCPMITEEGG